MRPLRDMNQVVECRERTLQIKSFIVDNVAVKQVDLTALSCPSSSSFCD